MRSLQLGSSGLHGVARAALAHMRVIKLSVEMYIIAARLLRVQTAEMYQVRDGQLSNQCTRQRKPVGIRSEVRSRIPEPREQAFFRPTAT
jgi:hypothetical protein